MLGFALSPCAVRPNGSAPFAPSDLSGLALWLDATQGITNDGGTSRVSSWASRVGSYVATQGTTAAMPTLASAAQNGLPGVLFDGADDNMRADAAAAILTGDVSYTTFVVAKLTDGTKNNTLYQFANSGSSNPVLSNLTYPTNNWQSRRRNDALTNVTAGVSPYSSATPHICTTTYSGSTLANRMDGAANASSAASGNLTLNWLFICSGNGGAYASAYLFEFLVWPRLLSSGEIAQVEAHLRAKWGTP